MTANVNVNGTKRRLRLGMVGGGPGAFIGAVHRIAARMDDRFELVAGALSSNPERSRAAALGLHAGAGLWKFCGNGHGGSEEAGPD